MKNKKFLGLLSLGLVSLACLTSCGTAISRKQALQILDTIIQNEEYLVYDNTVLVAEERTTRVVNEQVIKNNEILHIVKKGYYELDYIYYRIDTYCDNEIISYDEYWAYMVNSHFNEKVIKAIRVLDDTTEDPNDYVLDVKETCSINLDASESLVLCNEKSGFYYAKFLNMMEYHNDYANYKELIVEFFPVVLEQKQKIKEKYKTKGNYHLSADIKMSGDSYNGGKTPFLDIYFEFENAYLMNLKYIDNLHQNTIEFKYSNESNLEIPELCEVSND
jgi:hypothetical protein